ncbi:DUF433 domain-containing protein [Zunongwangia sp. F260]|uniref:DUF433 domain-containing protein n=1 Tax=Autumnicola lenta TaxID=3075593 RepID=A0ABU3CG49_9FLAO|nr:DUF433 domain-containing protein [Zunongwangia sp. F260]MDT0645336.1 DUF433 domain-containing protein [Zunongwangia sp. F260]
MIDYKQYIFINPNIRFGRTYLSGTRFSVYDALNWFANGMSQAEIKIDFPELTNEHIQACLASAADREHKIRVV